MRYQIVTKGSSGRIGGYSYTPTYREAADNGQWAALVARDAAERDAALRRAMAETRRLAVVSEPDRAPQKEEGDPMETLWQVLIVTKARKVIDAGTVVAPDESGADFEADVAGKLRAAGLKPRDVTVIRKNLGQVAVEKEPQKMRLVKDEGEATATA